MVSMQFDVTARDNASRDFESIADHVERLENKLTRLGRLRVEPSVQLNITPANRSLTQLQTRLDAIRNVRATVVVDGAADARREVTALVVEMRKIRDQRARVTLDGAADARRDVTELATRLNALSSTRIRLDVGGDGVQRANQLNTRITALAARSPIVLTVEVDRGNRAKIRLMDLAATAAALSAIRPRIQIDTDTAAASASLAALLAQLRGLTSRAHDIRVRMEDQSFLGQMARIREELNTIAGRKIEIDAETRGLMEGLADARIELARLEAMDPSVRVDADVEEARLEIRAFEERLNEIALRPYEAKVEVKVDFDKSLTARLGQVANLLTKVGVAGGVATAGAVQAGVAILSLVGSLGELVGLLPLVAGGLASAGAAGVTVEAGFVGMSDALKAIQKQDPEKFAEALQKMAPAGRETAAAIRDVSGEFNGLRMDVQQKLMAGWGDEVRQLGAAQLPVLREGMSGVATEVNKAGIELADFLESGQATDRVRSIFDSTKTTVGNLRPVLTDVTAGLLDIGEVGSAKLAELTEGAGFSAAGFRAMIAEARETGALEAGMDRAINVVHQLGDTAGNIGGIFRAMYVAARDEQVDFLTRLQEGTQAVEDFLNSARGQNALKALFSETRDTVDALTPGVITLGGAAADAVARFGQTDGLVRFGGAVSDVADTAAPLVVTLGGLAGNTLGVLSDAAGNTATALGPVAHVLSSVVEASGPIAPAVLAMTAAFVGAKVIQPIIAGMSTSMKNAATNAGTYTLGMTGSATAGQAVATAGTRAANVVGAFGKALPFVGFALVGLSAALSDAGDKSDDFAQRVATGSESMRQAIARETEAIESRNVTFDFWNDHSAEAAEMASDRIQAAYDKWYDSLSPMEQLQANVARAQGDLNDAVIEFGPTSDQARDAASRLNATQQELANAQDEAKDAAKSHTDALLEQQRVQLGAVDADIGYENSLSRLADAQDAAREAAKDHTAGSRELEDANRDVLQANLDVAAAAGEKAKADAIASGAANADEIAARAQKDELIRLADQCSGPTRQALLDAANGTDTLTRFANTAEIQARLHKDELGRLANQADGPLAAALSAARDHFDQLGGANATAEQKARAQKDELQRLANMASGPLRTELQRMADQINTLPNKTVTITADGKMGALTGFGAIGGPELTRMAHGGATGGILADPSRGLGIAHSSYADGGVLPGYTPGRDPHRFVGAAGTLELSGGEAIMRPEFTRAVTPEYVHAANRAARSGGVPGVLRFIQRTGPRREGREGQAGDGNRFADGGIYRGPVQRFAGGGLVRSGATFSSIVARADYEASLAMAAKMAPLVAARLKAVGGLAGPTTEAAARGLAWARTQVGKPYVWGGVGPGGYDCSGFMSAIVNVMRGRNPHSRVGSTATFPWAGFAPGLGAGLNIGAFKGSPGHMAGTIGGVNVESSGSAGVRVGGGARGASTSMFKIRAHLADRGGIFGPGEAVLNLSGRAERALTGRQNESFERLVAAVDGPRPASGGPARVATGLPPTSRGPTVAVQVDVARIVASVEELGHQLRAAAQLAHEDAVTAGTQLRGSLTGLGQALRGNVAVAAQSRRVDAELGRI